MLAKVYSGATNGLDSLLVEVEIDIASQGLPAFNIVGLPGKAVEEAKERVRAALKNSGIDFPPRRITVNLTPADLPKDSSAYDLPIAVGVMLAWGQVPPLKTKALFFGELSLDGSLRHTNGVLPVALLGRKTNIKQVFLPEVNAREAAIIRDLSVYPVRSLVQLFHHFSRARLILVEPAINLKSLAAKKSLFEFDLSEIRGQEQAKRALEIAAAGNHNLLFSGPPGAGKTMLARALPSILPTMTEEEMLEVTKIYSITGSLPAGESIMKTRPFRSPHHTISRIGLVGGGSRPLPGEISQAHRGVLFMDEFPEFPRGVLESLRQPMEDGRVTISRASGSMSFPAKFLLVAAMNPCPCGNLGSAKKHCTCLPGQVSRYKKRLSGPLLDRIDLHLSVPEVEIEKLSQESNLEKSRSVRKRVQKARELQLQRFKKLRFKAIANGELSTKQVKLSCRLLPEAELLLTQAARTMNLSARSYFRVVKVAQTITDLSGNEKISAVAIAEALQYREQEN